MAEEDEDSFELEGTDDSDPGQIAVVAALVTAHAAARQQVASNVTDLLGRLLIDFDGWYSDPDVAELAAEMADLVRQGQELTAEFTQQYLLAVLEEYDAAPRQVAPVELPERVRDVDPVVEFSRPAEQFRYRASIDDPDPLEAAVQRAGQQADLDLSLAMREASRQTLVSADRVTGWRRVIHPELSRTGVCALCVVAANQIYRTSELMPIHNGCRCTVAPITSTSDPGLTLDRQDLNALYGAAGGTDRRRLQRVRLTVRPHSEVGPVLTYGDHAFRGAAAAQAA